MFERMKILEYCVTVTMSANVVVTWPFGDVGIPPKVDGRGTLKVLKVDTTGAVAVNLVGAGGLKEVGGGLWLLLNVEMPVDPAETLLLFVESPGVGVDGAAAVGDEATAVSDEALVGNEALVGDEPTVGDEPDPGEVTGVFDGCVKLVDPKREGTVKGLVRWNVVEGSVKKDVGMAETDVGGPVALYFLQ
jgi:hypothetical protein